MPLDLLSIVGIAQTKGADYFALMRASRRVNPTLTINGKPLYDEIAVAKLLNEAAKKKPRARRASNRDAAQTTLAGVAGG
jgi:hypothetical protein